MKSKQSDLTVASFQYLKMSGDKTPKELHNFLVKEHKDLYEDVLESDVKKLKKWIILRDGISEKDGKISADDDKIMQEEDILKRTTIIPLTGVKEVPDDCCNEFKNEIINEYHRVYEESFGVLHRLHPDKFRSVEEEREKYSEKIKSMDCQELSVYLEKAYDVSFYGDIVNEYNNCLHGSDFTDKYAMLKEDIKAVEGEYKTPPELREGEFKLYAREDDNLTLAIKLKTENMFWTIDIENEEEMFDLFGAAGKYPAEVAKTVTKGKVVDSGKIKLGIQRDGYHEYFLEGNKFETKMHYRVLDVNGEKMWLAWTGFKQTPADKEGDEGKWNIYEDRYNKLPLPTEE
jgi:hypothetical protein